MSANVRMMKLSEIKIPARFQANPPGPDKIKSRVKLAGKRPLRVAVNQNGWLTDLYASYLAAVELGEDKIGAMPGRNVCAAVAATFSRNSKEYVWLVSDNILNDWKDRGIECRPGMKLAVQANNGIRQVRVTRVFELPFETADHAEIIGLWSHAKHRPEQHAEHEKLCCEIADYCKQHGLFDVDDFLALSKQDPAVLRLYQFASGKFAGDRRRAMIQTAIDNLAGRDSDGGEDVTAGA